MALLKVHVTLEPDRAADTEARAKVLDDIERVTQVLELNRSRFDRYGLLTGLVDESKVDQIRRVAGVKSVEPDRQRHLA
jgi:hypothetical protein